MSSIVSHIILEGGDWPDEASLALWAQQALAAAAQECQESFNEPMEEEPPELSLLFCDDARIRELNRQWRDQDKPTNVLSFPAGDVGAEEGYLGDIAMAYETIAREAAAEHKSLRDHAMHMIVHGFFHLLGHDHHDDDEAEQMERLERAALRRLGIADPYADTEKDESL